MIELIISRSINQQTSNINEKKEKNKQEFKQPGEQPTQVHKSAKASN